MWPLLGKGQAEILRWSQRQEIVDAPHPRKYSILRRVAASQEGCMAKKKQAKFSVTKAVKRNARERVGQPKPERVIVSEAQQAAHKRRHKETLADLLEREE
jgi:hypothetical protein